MSHSQPAGQQLSVNDLGVVLEALNKACVKWYNIGMQLGVEIDRLDVIKEQYDNPSDCLRETLKTWLKTYSSPTWSNIVDSLRSSVVGEVRLADDLKHKYCSTRNPSIAVTRHVPPTPVPVQPTTSQHLSTSATAVTQYSVLPSATSFPISEHPTPPPEMPAQPATVATPPHHPPQEHTGISLVTVMSMHCTCTKYLVTHLHELYSITIVLPCRLFDYTLTTTFEEFN